MGIFFNPNRYSVGLTPQVQVNSHSHVYFGNNSYADSFQNNSVEKFFDEKFIKTMIAKNPELQALLKYYKIKSELNLKELEDLKNNHCRDTQELCAEIAKNLPASLKNRINLKDLKDGALLHDFGKVLIPKEILNKPGVLDLYEHKIIDLHSLIGYELLENSGINDEILHLVKNHHNTGNSHGDVNLQILNIADKYSALTEARVYKRPMSPKQALMILYAETRHGEIEPVIFNALVKTVHARQKQTELNIS